MRKSRFAGAVAMIIMFSLLTSIGAAQPSGSESRSETAVKNESSTVPAPAPAALSMETVKVKGINDWEGEVTGKPAPGSKFEKLQIGMDMKDVIGMIGQPDSKGRSVTGKAFIPFYGGSDRSRYELVYNGHGRLIFSRSSRFSTTYNLTNIIHNVQETNKTE